MAAEPPSTPFTSNVPAQYSTRHAHVTTPLERTAYHASFSSSPSHGVFVPGSRVAAVSQPSLGLSAHARVLETTQLTVQGTVDNPLIPKKRRRTTPAELNILEHEFRCNARPDPLERARIAERLGMTSRAVQVWYQNRRQKEKKESSSSSSVASGGSDPRDLDGVLLSFSSSPLPSPALPLQASTVASTPRESLKAGLLSSDGLFSTSPGPYSSSSSGSNKENSYFPPMPTSSASISTSMATSCCSRTSAPGVLAVSAGLSATNVLSRQQPAAQQPYATNSSSPSTQGSTPPADVSTMTGKRDAPQGVYMHRASNASIIAAKKHVRKRPQGSHAPLARVPSLPHTFVFPPSPAKAASTAGPGAGADSVTRTAMARKASLNDVAARQQKKAVAAAGLFAHAQGETVAAAAQRRRSSTPASASPPAPTASLTAAPPPAFAPDELAPFAQNQPSSLATLTPMSKAKARDDLLRHMESDPPSASSPAPLTRRRMKVHDASMHSLGDDKDEALERGMDGDEDDEDLPGSVVRGARTLSATSLPLPKRPLPTRSLSASHTDTVASSASMSAHSGWASPMGRTVSLGAYPVQTSLARSASLTDSIRTVPHGPQSSRAGSSRSCAVEALGRKRASILESRLPVVVPTRAPSTRPSTSAYASHTRTLSASMALASYGGVAGVGHLQGKPQSQRPQQESQRKRRRVSAESTSDLATPEGSTGDDSFDLAESSFSSTSTASTVDSIVTMADTEEDDRAPRGYFALTAAAKHASAVESSLATAELTRTPEDEQRECAELLLGLGGFC